jgi:hypothetical protein
MPITTHSGSHLPVPHRCLSLTRCRRDSFQFRPFRHVSRSLAIGSTTYLMYLVYAHYARLWATRSKFQVRRQVPAVSGTSVVWPWTGPLLRAGPNSFGGYGVQKRLILAFCLSSRHDPSYHHHARPLILLSSTALLSFVPFFPAWAVFRGSSFNLKQLCVYWSPPPTTLDGISCFVP